MVEMVDVEAVDIAVIGSGPAGLGAALAARRAGLSKVVVLEREAAIGGTPRHCGHPPFGMREFGRVLTGPGYAKRLVALATRQGVDLRPGHSIVKLHPGGVLDLATPDGVRTIKASRVLLATGTRETPRSARLIGGDRGQGVMTTATLQRFLYEEGRRPFRSPVILGSELVSFSAVLSCLRAGIRPVAMVEPGIRVIARWPSAVLPRLFGIPLLLDTKIEAIRGQATVEAVGLRQPDGAMRELAADGVVTTGCFVPVSELLRGSHLDLDRSSDGPSIDQFGRLSDPTYYAAGNVLGAVETAGWCYREGQRIGACMAADLEGRLPTPAPTVWLRPGEGIRLALPQRITCTSAEGGLDHIQVRANQEIRGELRLEAHGRCLFRRRVTVRPERRLLIPLPNIGRDDTIDLTIAPHDASALNQA